MAKQTFAMSMYASKADLYQAKAEYYEREIENLRNEMLENRNLQKDLSDRDDGYCAGKATAYDEAAMRLNDLL
jgi:hypothetical protein